MMLAAVGLAALTLTTPATTGAGGYWIVLASDRDGQTRGYSVRPDGSRLSPLLPLTRALVPADISADGRIVVHHELYAAGAYVSRANGTGFHRVPGGRIISRDGRLLAFARLYENDKRKNGIWIVGAGGRGLRHIASNRELDLEDWSPDGKALLLIANGDDRSRLIVQPLHGTARVIARGPDFGDAAWSPSGRWIAWSAERNGKRSSISSSRAARTGTASSPANRARSRGRRTAARWPSRFAKGRSRSWMPTGAD